MHNNTEDSWGMVFQPHWEKEREGLLAPLTLTNWSIGLFKVWQKISWIIFSLWFDWSGTLLNFGVSTAGGIHRHCKISLVARPGAEQDAWRLSAGSASVSLWRKPLNTSLFADLPPRHQRLARLPSEVQQCRWHILQVHGVLQCLSLIWGSASSLLFDLKPRGCQPTLLAWTTFLWISTAYHSVRDAPTYQFFSCF